MLLGRRVSEREFADAHIRRGDQWLAISGQSTARVGHLALRMRDDA